MNKLCSTFIIALAAFLHSASASSEPANASGAYIGVGTGIAILNDGGLSEDLEDDISRTVNTNVEVEIEEDGTPVKLHLGYRFNPIVGIELGYTDYKNFRYTANVTSISTTVKTQWFSSKSTSLSANLGYTFDIGVRPFAVVGLSSIKYDGDKETAFHFGYGIEYSPKNTPIALRLAYESDIHIEDDIDRLYYEDAYAITSSLFYAGINFEF